MNRSQTFAVDRAYSSGPDDDRRHWVTIKGHARPYQMDALLAEGQSVVVNGGRAERHFNYKDQ